MTPKKDVGERLSPKRYALHRGISRQAVMRAVATGRLSGSLSKNDAGHHVIDVAAADLEWEAWTNPSKSRAKKKGGRPRVAAATPSMFEREERTQAVSQARASAERTQVDAELKRLQLKRELDQLVDRAFVQVEAFRLGRSVRDRILQVPDRISAQLRACTTTAAVHERLMVELIEALEDLATTEGAA